MFICVYACVFMCLCIVGQDGFCQQPDAGTVMALEKMELIQLGSVEAMAAVRVCGQLIVTFKHIFNVFIALYQPFQLGMLFDHRLDQCQVHEQCGLGEI